jgi:hypothetical protein
MTNCRKCGVEMPPQTGRGRRRKLCKTCSPPKIKGRMPNSTNLTPLDPMGPQVTAEDVSPGMEVWTPTSPPDAEKGA